MEYNGRVECVVRAKGWRNFCQVDMRAMGEKVGLDTTRVWYFSGCFMATAREN